jgi:S-methylmethionine-dependent homocysteine/selenocysteine methylase
MREHGQMIQYLNDAGVDLILIETMCSAREAIAAAKSAKDEWAISFCLQPDELGLMLDGTPAIDIIQEFEHAKFVGINCYPAPQLAAQVKHLSDVMTFDLPIAAYGNVGYADDEGGWINTDAVDPNAFAEYAMDWVKAGASIVGGCCGTTPKTIASIKSKL